MMEVVAIAVRCISHPTVYYIHPSYTSEASWKRAAFTLCLELEREEYGCVGFGSLLGGRVGGVGVLTGSSTGCFLDRS